MGILASISVAAFTSAQSKGRDAKRKADIDALRKALELSRNDTLNAAFYPQCNPAATSCAPSSTLPALAPTYIKTVPTDPRNTSPFVYTYAPSPASCTANCSGYALSACLENANDLGPNTIAPVAPCTTRTFQVTHP